MAIAYLLFMVFGFYFMLAPQDANKRMKVSFRNQTKYLIVMFAVIGANNLFKLFTAFTLGSFGLGLYAAVFLVLDIYLINLYLRKL
jgi:hypothetical protein